MQEIDLSKINKVHFIGIGGIGISALAKMMLNQGFDISGINDCESSNTLSELFDKSVDIKISTDFKDVKKDADLYIYSLAWDDLTPDLMKETRKLGKPVLTYFEGLGLISKDSYTIAVSGTHGKTTTTAMIAKVLLEAKKSPTVIVGSLLKEYNSNFVSGDSDLFVVEACEYRRSFLNLHPKIAIITNIDNDHLDYYKDIEDIKSAFREFVLKVPRDGYVICDTDDEKVKEVIAGLDCKVINYRDYLENDLPMAVQGVHNKLNASIALAVADILKLNFSEAEMSVSNFEGTWRRFELKGETENGTTIYDDYGHHPTEIKATLRGAREKFVDKKIIVAFQPHLYSRTKMLLGDFSNSFIDVDKVLILPIYAAREHKDPSINSEMLANKIGDRALYVENFDIAKDLLSKELKRGDIFITIGAGDVYKIGEMMLNQ